MSDQNTNPGRAKVGPVSVTPAAVHDPLTCELCHAEGTGAEIAHYRDALKAIRAYFIGGWPDTEDCARIWKLADEALS